MKKQTLLGNSLLRGILLSSFAISILFSSCSTDDSQIAPKAKTSEIINLPKNAKEITHSVTGQGTNAGYYYTLWVDPSSGGTADITFPLAGTYPGSFQIKYNGKGCVGGKGWATGSNTRVINYNVGYLSGSYDFVGAYGWVQSPLIEYYVVEKGFMPWNFTKPNGEYGEKIGDTSVDGHTYTVARHKRVNAASIEGDGKTFWQYINNWGGQTFNGNKKISMKGHTDYWKLYGGKGWGSTHNYQVFGLEAFGGKTGQIDASVW